MFLECDPPILHPQSPPPQLLPERQTQPRSVQEYRLYLLRVGQTLLGDILGGISALRPDLTFGHHVESFFRISWVCTARCPRVFYHGAKPNSRHLAWIDERLVQLYHTHNLLGSVAE